MSYMREVIRAVIEYGTAASRTLEDAELQTQITPLQLGSRCCWVKEPILNPLCLSSEIGPTGE